MKKDTSSSINTSEFLTFDSHDVALKEEAAKVQILSSSKAPVRATSMTSKSDHLLVKQSSASSIVSTPTALTGYNSSYNFVSSSVCSTDQSGYMVSSLYGGAASEYGDLREQAIVTSPPAGMFSQMPVDDTNFLLSSAVEELPNKEEMYDECAYDLNTAANYENSDNFKSPVQIASTTSITTPDSAKSSRLRLDAPVFHFSTSVASSTRNINPEAPEFKPSPIRTTEATSALKNALPIELGQSSRFVINFSNDGDDSSAYDSVSETPVFEEVYRRKKFTDHYSHADNLLKRQQESSAASREKVSESTQCCDRCVASTHESQDASCDQCAMGLQMHHSQTVSFYFFILTKSKQKYTCAIPK